MSHVKMLEARKVCPGMTFSPDGGRVIETVYNAASNSYTITEICHGVEKKADFNANTKLPIYVED